MLVRDREREEGGENCHKKQRDGLLQFINERERERGGGGEREREKEIEG